MHCMFWFPNTFKQIAILIHRLDEISDEEDLDLIPPRPVEDRCQCCGAVTWQGCVISWIVHFTAAMVFKNIA